MSQSLLKATDLRVSYGNHSSIFSELSFSIGLGEWLGLSGPSGSGKTTLLRLCAGLYGLDHHPNVEGNLQYDGKLDLLKSSPKSRQQFRRDSVSMITENPRAGLHPQRRIFDSWKHYAMSTDLNQHLVALGIKDVNRIANAYPHELSGGEAQRVRLAFALSKSPKLLLLESPTAALDAVNAKLVWDQVRQAKAAGTSILQVDHNLQLLAANADRRLHLGKEALSDYDGKPTLLPLGDLVLAAANVCVNYDGFQAVREVKLHLHSSEFVALLGASGSGKSSLGRALSGIQPATGTLEIEGASSAFAKTAYDRADNRVQYIWQEPRLSMNPKFSVEQTLREAIGSRGTLPAALLELVGLETEKLKQNTLSLSTGEQQRLAIARALAVNPKVLVCDEITSGLDTTKAQHILKTLHALREALGIAVLFITHDEDLAATHASRRIAMRAGELF